MITLIARRSYPLNPLYGSASAQRGGVNGTMNDTGRKARREADASSPPVPVAETLLAVALGGAAGWNNRATAGPGPVV